jgi:type II restriction/modification system DNA methylase subunit YeeA
MIVEPVILRPLREEWKAVRTEIETILTEAEAKRPKFHSGAADRLAERAMAPFRERAEGVRRKYIERLRAVTILDSACGSGNFLYLALQGVKDIELKANLECEALGLPYRAPVVGPEIVHGIEINPLAAELARTTIWIGDIQWRRRNGIYSEGAPILRKLDSIECRDALITKKENGSYEEAKWPEAEFIVGNPPFLGDKKFTGKLDKSYVFALRQTYLGRVGGNVDLVCYWFEKARSQIEAGIAKRVGLVATNAIRRGANRRTLDRIASLTPIFEAWSDEKWILEGAAVRVSLVCFGRSLSNHSILDGEAVARIHPDLTSGATDITKAARLKENKRVAFLGVQKSGPLDIPGLLAREWLLSPQNPNGRYNAEALRPFWNGDDITSRWSGYWLIDLPHGLKESEVALFQQPFEYLKAARYQPDDGEDLRTLREAREQARDKHARERWWEPYWPRPEMRSKIAKLARYIVTPETPTYTVFAWLPGDVVPDKNLIVVTRDDYTSFGILHSNAHLLWVRALGSPYGNHPTARRYNSSRVFETFPFPEGLTPNIPAKDYANDPRAIAIATAAKRLDELRNAWLNPPDLIDIVPEVVPGYPDRILPKTEAAAAELKKRTLTNLYNARPQWLSDAHRDLDAAVAAAYGWPADISEEDALAKLPNSISRAPRPALRLQSPTTRTRCSAYFLLDSGSRVCSCFVLSEA